VRPLVAQARVLGISPEHLTTMIRKEAEQ